MSARDGGIGNVESFSRWRGANFSNTMLGRSIEDSLSGDEPGQVLLRQGRLEE